MEQSWSTSYWCNLDECFQERPGLLEKEIDRLLHGQNVRLAVGHIFGGSIPTGAAAPGELHMRCAFRCFSVVASFRSNSFIANEMSVQSKAVLGAGYSGSPVHFHHRPKSCYSCYELTFHELDTFTMLFLTYRKQLLYYATNSWKTMP